MNVLKHTQLLTLLSLLIIVVFFSFYLVQRLLYLEDALENCQNGGLPSKTRFANSQKSSNFQQETTTRPDVNPFEERPQILIDYPGEPWKKPVYLTDHVLQDFLSSHPKKVDGGILKRCNRLEKSRKRFIHGHARWLHEFRPLVEMSNFSEFLSGHTFVKDIEDSDFRIHSVLIPVDKYKDVPYYRFAADGRHCESWETSMSAGQESYKAGCRSRGSNIQCGIENIDPVDVLLPVESDEAKQWFVDIYNDYHQTHVITARNAVVFDGDIWTCGQEMLSTTACGFDHRWEKEGFKRHAHPEIQTPIVDKVLNIGGGPGYYHWIAESLLRLVPFLHEVRADKSITIFINNRNDYLFQWIELLGIERERLHTIDPITGREVIHPEATICCCNRRIPSLMLRDAVYENLPAPGPFREKHILVIRRSKRRWIRNMDDLLSVLQKNYPDVPVKILGDVDMPPLREYATWFQNAKVVVGMFGAGLTNVVFCEPGTVVIEFGFYVKGNHYIQLAASLGLRYVGIDCGWDSLVPPAKFMWALELSLGKPRKSYKEDDSIGNYELRNGTVQEIFDAHTLWLSGLLKCSSVKLDPVYYHAHGPWFPYIPGLKPPQYSNFTSLTGSISQSQGLDFRIRRVAMQWPELRDMYIFTASSARTCRHLHRKNHDFFPCRSPFLNKEIQCSKDISELAFGQRLLPDDFKTAHPDLLLANKDYTFDVFTARDVIIFDGDVWTCNHRLVSLEGCDLERRMGKKEIYQGGLGFDRMTSVLRVFVLSCGHSLLGFTTQCLPRLMPFLPELLAMDVKILTTDARQYVTTILTWLGFSDDDLLVGRGARAFEAFIPENSICSCTRGPPLLLTSNHLRSRIENQQKENVDAIILLNRKIRNMSSFINKLKKLGWKIEVRELEDFTMFDRPLVFQAFGNLFASTKMFISATSDAFGYLPFMTPGSRVLEIFMGGGANFQTMAGILGLKYHAYEPKDNLLDVALVLETAKALMNA